MSVLDVISPQLAGDRPVRRLRLAWTLGASLGLLSLGACEARPPAPSSKKPAPEAAVPPSSDASFARTNEPLRVGTPVPGGARTELAEVLRAPEGFTGKKVIVEGHVRRACSRKGCWMEIAENADPASSACRVTFKDYGFFVPTDSPGSQVRLEGEVTVKTLRKAHVDHLESEGAHFSQKNPDGSAPEVQIVATGVELRRS